MQTPEIETAAPTAIGNGGGHSKGLATRGTYPTFSLSANEFAAAVLVERYRLTPCLARLTVELAQLGGRQP
jgi:hypothetical protein